MDFHEITNVVCCGEDKNGLYKIWPSAKHPGYFYVDRIIYPIKEQPCFAESTKKPMSIEAVNWWINEHATGAVWRLEKWDGKEFNFFDGRPTKKKTGVVYFIEALNTGFVKIGRGTGRLEQLQTGCPFELRLLCEIESTNASRLENKLHKQFGKYHHLNEWYVYSDEIKKFISEKTNADR